MAGFVSSTSFPVVPRISTWIREFFFVSLRSFLSFLHRWRKKFSRPPNPAAWKGDESVRALFTTAMVYRILIV